MELADRQQERVLTRRDDTNDRGFTLLETSIALVVMMVVTLGTASLFVYAINNNDGSNDQALALAIAQQRMERLRRTPFDGVDLTTTLSTETVTSAGRRYTVQTTICSTSDCGGSATLKIITVQVTPQNSAIWANNPAVIVSRRAGPLLGPYAGS
jgi:prepilin-type N-terminal cleavage/methylation domain-containing protein